MDTEDEIFSALDIADPTEGESGGTGRRICGGGCGRLVSVCLCDEMPSQPIATATEIFILQHPHERRHRLATVPVLARCLENCQVEIGRRLRPGSAPILDSLLAEASANLNRPHRAIFLFPGTESTPSMEINQWNSSVRDHNQRNLVLIVFDGTWKHAKEMVTASLPFISKLATCVCFDYNVEACGGSIFDSELLLRKEPYQGCMSTMEAVARALAVIEPAGAGTEIEDKLVRVLRAMVSLQACHLKPVKPRPKLIFGLASLDDCFDNGVYFLDPIPS